MASKALFVICAFTVFIQSITAQCEGGLAGNNGYGIRAAGLNLANGYGNGNGFAPSNGGSFTVSSYSPITPTGLSVVSENAIDGSLAVSGSLPFLSAIGLEGQVPANGAAGVSYGCGNGNVGIVSENAAPAVAGYNGLAGPGLGGLGYGASLTNNGLSLANAGLAGPALNGPISRAPGGNLY